MGTVTQDAPAAAENAAGPTNRRDTSIDVVTPGAVDEVIAAVEERLRLQRLPVATYRVQFNNLCSFAEIEQAIPYLYTLGISDLYASPFLKSRPGSLHGYDIINHATINPEIGTIEELRSLRSALREHDMGLIADVVPNHMSATPQLNAWWQDVLENGPSSQFAGHFDIDWMPLKPDLADKVLLPVLGDQFGKVLEDGQLTVHYGEGTFWLQYFEHRFPLAPRSYTGILGPRLNELPQRLGAEHPDLLELLSILTAIRNLPSRTETDADRLIERRREKEVVKRRLHELITRSRDIAAFIEGNVVLINGIPGQSQSFNALDALLQEQAYRLAFWRVAADEINYRRFFDINELAAICTEHPQVFADTHRLLFDLLDEGTITGLRIDHPDGLYAPLAYLFQLQEHHFIRLCREAFFQRLPSSGTTPQDNEPWLAAKERLRALWSAAVKITASPLARPLFVVVEKILAHGEPLPEDWPVHGTVGYEFLNAMNELFVDPQGERALSTFYSKFTERSLDFNELAYQGKRLIVRMSMASELNVLGHRLDRISERNRWTRDFTLNSLTRALQEVIACFQVYRTYVQPGHVLERDRRIVEEAVASAKRRNPAMDASIFDFVGDTILLRFHAHADDEERRAVERFVGKFQQLTGPIMAKGVEDTTFYRFNRLVSLNEVGSEPTRFGTSAAEFHQFIQSRLPRLAHSLNASSTHDTKRSEDTRARINVISEIPKQWRERVQRWPRMNQRLKCTIDGVEAPSRNSEYLLYQTLVGIWPRAIPVGTQRTIMISRMQQYMQKVVREAKIHTSWISPNEGYESATSQFVAGLFEGDHRHRFLADMHEFASQIAENGRYNSLSQLILKMASPGVPDFYQGTELWNYTLVDPDNRGPIDFAQRRTLIDELLGEMGAALGHPDRDRAVEAWLDAVSAAPEPTPPVNELVNRLLDHRADGRIKLFATLLTLRTRRQNPALFTTGDYESLTITGPHAEHLIAFARRHEDQTLIVAVPRLTVGLVGLGGPPPSGNLWGETQIQLPEYLRGQLLKNIYTLQLATSVDEPCLLAAASALSHLPFCVMISAGSRSNRVPGTRPR